MKLQLVHSSTERGSKYVIKSDTKLGPMDQMRNLTDRIRDHVPYYERDHDNDSVKLEQSHRIPKKSGGFCSCAGNPMCPHCGGNGIIP